MPFDCRICAHQYNTSERRPVFLPGPCGRTICLSCAENYRATKVAELKGNEKYIKCMYCDGRFHSENDEFVENRDYMEDMMSMGIDNDVSATRVEAISCTSREEAESANGGGQRRARVANHLPCPPQPVRSSRRIAARKARSVNQTDQQVLQTSSEADNQPQTFNAPASTSPLAALPTTIELVPAQAKQTRCDNLLV